MLCLSLRGVCHTTASDPHPFVLQYKYILYFMSADPNWLHHQCHSFHVRVWMVILPVYTCISGLLTLIGCIISATEHSTSEFGWSFYLCIRVFQVCWLGLATSLVPLNIPRQSLDGHSTCVYVYFRFADSDWLHHQCHWTLHVRIWMVLLSVCRRWMLHYYWGKMLWNEL